MAVNKVVMNTENGEEILMDLTNDTVTPSALAEGETAHNASGALIVGTATPVELVQEFGTREDAVVSQKVVSQRLSDMNTLLGGGINVANNNANEAKNKAEQALAKADSIAVPTSLSQLSGDSTHRLVTDAEKQTWNNKLDRDDLESVKAEITRMVIESLGGNPIFGYVDENNNIVVKGDLADGTYSVKYETDDETIDIGNLVIDNNVYYSVTSTLTNCKSNNSAKEVVEDSAYSATITADDGYELKTVTVTMAGQNISVSDGVINIANVTGDIVITAVAEEIKVAEPTNFADPTSVDWKVGYRLTTDINQVTTLTGGVATNYITVQEGDVIEVSGINFEDNNNRQAWKFGGDYESIGKASAMVNSASFSNVSYNSNKLNCTVNAPQSSSMRIRFSGIATGSSNDVVVNITRNGVLL